MEVDINYLMNDFQDYASKIISSEEYKPEVIPSMRILQVVKILPFDAAVSWEVYRTWNNENDVEYFLIKSSWNKKKDYEKLQVPKLNLKLRYNKIDLSPSINREYKTLENKFVEQIFNELLSTKISPMSNEIYTSSDNIRVGLDGTNFILKVEFLNQYCCYRWWEDASENWSELNEFSVKLIESLDLLV